MSWKLIIDTAEQQSKMNLWAPELDRFGIIYERRRLDTGDFWIVFSSRSDEEVWCIIERKTPDDMYASIVGQKNVATSSDRYWDQATRMNASGAHRVAYMIVGNIETVRDRLRKRVPQKSIMSALAHIQMAMPRINCFPVCKESDVPHVLKSLLRYCEEEKQKESGESSSGVRSTDVSAHCKKRSAEDSGTALKFMLCQIKGVSEIIADAIVRYYPSMSDLIDAYRGCDDAKLLLASFSASKNRKIGPTISERIYRLLFNTED